MKPYYDKDLDRIEILQKGKNVFGHEVDSDLTLFLYKKSEKFIGFGLSRAEKNIGKLVNVPVRFRLAAIVFLIRMKYELTQRQFGEKVGVTERTIQRIESCEANLTLENTVSIAEEFPEYDLSVLLKVA